MAAGDSFQSQSENHIQALRASPEYDRVREAVEAMAACDDEQYITGMEQDLRRAYALWSAEANVGDATLAAVRFYWAGAEVDPWVPSTVWADGLGAYELEDGRLIQKESLFRERGGFDLALMDDFLMELVEDPDIQDLDLFDDLKWAFVYRTFAQCAGALERTGDSEEFRAMAPCLKEGFVFLGTGGHDEETVILLKPD